MSRKVEIEVFTFDELDDKAKDVARDWYRSASVGDEWWDSVYEDAENVGIKITSFDLGGRREIDGKFLASAEETAHKIEKDHGAESETYKTASAYLAKRDSIVNDAPRDADGEFEDEGALDEALDAVDDEFLHAILEDYLIMLDHEYEYQNSDEVVEENIRANEYEFLKTGKLA
jgi:hypothetical protein